MQNEKNFVHCDRRNHRFGENGKRPHAGDYIGGAFKRRAAGEKPVRGGYRAAVQLRQYQHVLEAVDPRGPLAVNFAFATVLVPSIAGALAVKDYKEASSKINYSLLISILIILPCAIGLITLAEPIYKILYFSTSSGFELLQLVSVSLIFAALAQTMTGSLQGLGKVYVPAISLLFGCIAKIVLNIVLIRIPSINIYGAAISSIACQFISCAICFVVLAKNCKLNIKPMKYILKPIIAGVVMGVVAVGVYKLSMLVCPSGFIGNLISTVIAIAIAAVVYFFTVFMLKILSEDEIKQLPMGTKIYNGLVKLKFYKAQ